MKVSFDGKGLNAQDSFASRLATFTEEGFKQLKGDEVAQALNSHEDVVAALRAALPALRRDAEDLNNSYVLDQAFNALKAAGVTLTALIADATVEDAP